MAARAIDRLAFPAVLVMAAVAAFSPSALRADEVADFYKGRQIRLVIGSNAGGAYDVYARTVVRHMGRHIPGNPTFIPQNMIGAGGRSAADWLYNIAPKDGSVIGTISQSAPLDQARRQAGIRFDAAKFGWIGNPVVDNLVTVAWSASGLATIADVKAKGGLICGGSGASTPGIINPQILNNMLGTNIRIVSGYGGILQIALAMQQGEVNCMGAYSWSSMKSEVAYLLSARKLNMIVQWGAEPNRDVSAYQGREVPLITEFATSDIDRRVLRLVESGVEVGRPLLAPPDVPLDRLAALRRAFDETMKDPKFLAEAAAQNLDISPVSSGKLQQVVNDVVRSDDATVARANELMRARDVREIKDRK